MNILKKFSLNEKGKDWVVGDIHGMFSLVYKTLDDVEFDRENDRLFCVGDLIDRGKESEQVLDFLSLPYVHSVMGNHEQMCIDAFNDESMEYVFFLNGGGWWKNVPQNRKNMIAYELMELPLTIEVELTEGRKVGIVHADVPYSNWDELNKLCSKQDTLIVENLKNIMLWSRDRINTNNTNGVSGIHHVYVGHTPLDNVKTLGNVTYIDTGACFSGGKLTLLCLTNQQQNLSGKTMTQMRSVERVDGSLKTQLKW